MTRKLVIFILIITTISCEPNQNDIGNYQEINEIFDRTEIQDLREIIQFFNTAICTSENLSNDDVNKCYNQYLKRLNENLTTEVGLELQISFEDQKAFLEQLNPNTLNQIWSYEKIWNKTSDTLEIRDYNLGKYMEFLKEFGKANDKANKYYENLMSIGVISPSAFADMLINYREYNTEDERIKLLIAIHYLTINEENYVRKKLKSLEEANKN